jgi:hypothetical protein
VTLPGEVREELERLREQLDHQRRSIVVRGDIMRELIEHTEAYLRSRDIEPRELPECPLRDALWFARAEIGLPRWEEPE